MLAVTRATLASIFCAIVSRVMPFHYAHPVTGKR
jgi:hypothetical protein